MKKLSSSVFSYIFPRIRDAIFIGILIAVLSQGPSILNGDGDLGRHITIGKYIVSHWRIPTQDIFSHTRTGAFVVPHEWLAQVIFSIMHAWMGLSGVVLLIATLITLTFVLTYQNMLNKDVSRLVSLVMTAVAAFASSLHWLTRPHIFTFLFVAIWNHLLENSKNRLWLFPVVMLLWANTHGAFVAGFLIWLGHLGGWLWDYLQGQNTKEIGIQLLKIGIVSLVVTLINPVGWQLWENSLGYVGSRFLVDQTIEYQSPNFHNWSTWPFLIMVMLGILLPGLGARLRSHEAFLLAGWTALSLYSARNIPLFAILAAPYLGKALEAVLARVTFLQAIEQRIFRVERNLHGAFYPLVSILIAMIVIQARPATIHQFNANKFPVEAVEWLEVHPQEGKMFNNFIWGGYLLYRLWPQQTVFIDGQTDFYGEALTREYTQVMRLEDGWETILQKYDVSWVIVQSGQPLVQALRDKMGWRIVYQDHTTTILNGP